DALHQAEQAIDDLLDNFPNRLVAGVMRLVIFPICRWFTGGYRTRCTRPSKPLTICWTISRTVWWQA
ncbi:hypothetical protein CKQ90_08700, partial [Klebsiella pneumoniae]